MTQDASYSDYHQWLFPGGPLYTQNPLEPGATVDEVLAEVSCHTGVPIEWLAMSTREVMEGLAGLQCLWFLHGASGQAQGQSEAITPRWAANLAHLISNEAVVEARGRGTTSDYVTGTTSVYVTAINWQKGNFTLKRYIKDRKPVEQTYRIGRFIDHFAKVRSMSERDRLAMHHDLKWRAKADRFVWWVSAHPYDVLTMSHGRPWPSCMKPGGLFEYGPLTDMAAGSVVVWFKPVGSDSPSGRIILRPYIEDDGGPGIATGGRLYGTGPDIRVGTLNEMLGPWLHGIEIKRVEVCPIGKDGGALTREIYSDTDNVAGGCEQDMDEYAEAYDNLAHTNWPKAALVTEDLTAAGSLADDLTYRSDVDEGEDEEEALSEAVHQLLYDAMGYASQGRIFSELNPSALDVYTWMTTDGTFETMADDILQVLLSDTSIDDYDPIRELSDGLTSVPDYMHRDISERIRTEATAWLGGGSEFFTLLTFAANDINAPATAKAQAKVPEIIAHVSPHDLHSLLPYMFSYNVELTLNAQGKAIDNDTGTIVTDILIVPDWVVEELPDITVGALVVDEGNAYLGDELMGHVGDFLCGR